MSEFKEKAINEVAEINPENLSNGELNFIQYIDISSVSKGELDEIQYIKIEEAPSRAKRKVKANDTIFSTVRPGNKAYLYFKSPDENVIVSTGYAVLRPREINPRYLYYAVSSDSFIKPLAKRAKGAAYPAVNIEDIKKSTILVPSLKIQKSIVEVLSPLDDLIDNNKKRIEILEEMAETIYREWFVNFNFPGSEDVEMKDSEIGPIPESFTIKRLFNVANKEYGKAFSSDKFNEKRKGKQIIRIRNIPDNSTNTYTTESADEKYIVKNGDILVGMDGKFHMCRWAGGESWLNQRVAKFRPKDDIPSFFLFFALRRPVRRFNSSISGTTVKHLGNKHLKTVKLSIPPKLLLKKVNKLFKPMYNLEIKLRHINRILREARDLLLPRLISGEIEV